jgi:DNA-binding NarL/FixJ family response regulator
MPTLLVADEDAGLRERVRSLLGAEPDLRLSHASDCQAAMVAAEQGGIDAVLASAELLDGPCGNLLSRLRGRTPIVPVIVMTGAGQARQTMEALRRGAAAYVSKENLDRELREVVDEVLTSARIERRHRHIMACLQETRSHFVLDNDLELIPPLVEHIDKDLAEIGLFDATVRMRIGVAIQEALVNAMVHGNLEIASEVRYESPSRHIAMAEQRRDQPPYRGRKVHILTHETQASATYIVRDSGPGFDPTRVPDCTDPANLDRPCGRGLLLIRSFMDEVRFNEKGNEVTMVVRRKPAGEAASGAAGDGQAA